MLKSIQKYGFAHCLPRVATTVKVTKAKILLAKKNHSKCLLEFAVENLTILLRPKYLIICQNQAKIIFSHTFFRCGQIPY